MSAPKEPSKVFVFLSLLYRKDQVTHQELRELFREKFGQEIEWSHPFFPMKSYYAREMGEENLLERVFLVSQNLYERDLMVDLKYWAWEKEERFTRNNVRILNIDVGMISLENLTLATGKNFIHRIYLGRGVFSDLTLIYQGNSFQTLPWSYPDYSHPEVIDFFNWMRHRLKVEQTHGKH